jgi:hypothetical protein
MPVCADGPLAGACGARDREDADMAGPSWLAAAFAAAMIVTAIYCAGRLAASRLWRRATEVDADAVHIVMGTAMAGMLLPRLSPLPGGAWEAVFGIAAAWFTIQAIRSLRRSTTGRWCAQPVPHLVESAAMIYMFVAVPGSQPSGPSQGMAMPTMGSGHAGATDSFPALAIVLALFMTGYVLWTADHLTTLARATARATTTGAAPEPTRAPVTIGALAAAAIRQSAAAPRPAAAAAARHGLPAGSPALAPRLAACYKITMGITMSYMLIMML